MLTSTELTKGLKGRVISPDDPGYDEARTVFYGGVDRRPALIVRVADAADVLEQIGSSRTSMLSR